MIGGVRYVDDSKATNVEAAIRAMRSFDTGVHLILGGSRKGGGFEAAGPRGGRAGGGPVPDRRVGEPTWPCALAAEGHAFDLAGTLDRAVALARAAARPGDTVLLAPACASFDQFRDYGERGDVFQRLVREGA